LFGLVGTILNAHLGLLVFNRCCCLFLQLLLVGLSVLRYDVSEQRRILVVSQKIGFAYVSLLDVSRLWWSQLLLLFFDWSIDVL